MESRSEFEVAVLGIVERQRLQVHSSEASSESFRCWKPLLAAALNDPTSRGEMQRLLRPNDGIEHDTLFARLSEMCRLMGWSEDAWAIVSEAWLLALEGSAAAVVEANLTALLGSKQHFWGLLSSLGSVLVKSPVQVAFLAPWLRCLLTRVARDMAAGKARSAIRQFAEQRASDAIAVLQQIDDDLDAVSRQLKSFLLGTLRSQILNAADFAQLTPIADGMSLHPNDQQRAAWFESWATTAWQKGISSLELGELLSRYPESGDTDQQLLIAVVARIVEAAKTATAVRQEALHWLRESVMYVSHSDTKYAVISLVVDKHAADLLDYTSVGIELVRACLPIPAADAGTWSQVERLLVDQLASNPEAFTTTFKTIAGGSAASWLEVLSRPREFEWLKNTMSQADMSGVIAEVALTTDWAQRRLALHLFDQLNLEQLSLSVLQAADPRRLQLAFFESQRVMMNGEAIGRLLATLLPYAEAMDPQFQGEFFDEVLLQCQNRGGATRSEIESRVGTHPRIVKIMSRVAELMAERRSVSDSAIAAMNLPGYEKAGRRFLRRQSAMTDKAMREHSVVLQFCKQVALLYGRKWSRYFNGALSESSSLSRIESGIEVPILDLGDPEGMRLRRLQASRRIAELEQAIAVEAAP
jgi:hypothetical protein